jgi:hypothetical protein
MPRPSSLVADAPSPLLDLPGGLPMSPALPTHPASMMLPLTQPLAVSLACRCQRYALHRNVRARHHADGQLLGKGSFGLCCTDSQYLADGIRRAPGGIAKA